MASYRPPPVTCTSCPSSTKQITIPVSWQYGICRVRAISAFCFKIVSTCLPAAERSVPSARSKARSMSGSRPWLASMQSFLTASVMAEVWMSRMATWLVGAGSLGVEGLRPFLHLARRHVLLVRRQRPLLTVRILHATDPIAPEHVGDRHDRLRARGQRLLDRGVHRLDVDVEVDRTPAQRLRRLGAHGEVFFAQHEE